MDINTYYMYVEDDCVAPYLQQEEKKFEYYKYAEAFNNPEYEDCVLEEKLMSNFEKTKEYLASLKWDKVKRLETWLLDYCGVADSEYNRRFSYKCIYDIVYNVVLDGRFIQNMDLAIYGEQGVGKSRLVQFLKGEEFKGLVVEHENEKVGSIDDDRIHFYTSNNLVPSDSLDKLVITKFDEDSLLTIRDQLFAEAFFYI